MKNIEKILKKRYIYVNRGFPRGVCKVISAEGLAQALKDEGLIMKSEVSDYFSLANIALAFVDLKPEHKLYKSIRQDLKRYLKKVKKVKI